VNKKKQKNFVKLGRARFSATVSVKQKFLRRFFQKAAASYILSNDRNRSQSVTAALKTSCSTFAILA
jgi:hypothetical protein